MRLPPRAVGRVTRGLGSPSFSTSSLTSPLTSQASSATSQIPGASSLIDTAGAQIPTITSGQIVDYTTQAAFANMPPAVQEAITTGAARLQNAQPAFDLIDTLASHQSPSLQAVVLGLSAAVGVINPVAGAMMYSIGEVFIEALPLFQQLFGSLGFGSGTPAPTWDYLGLIRVNVDNIPAPPIPGGYRDPLWMPINPVSGLVWQSYITPDLVDLSAWVPPNMPAPYAPNAASNTANQPFLDSIITCATRIGPSSATQIPPPALPPPSAFEIYYNTLWLQNVESWANGNPYIPARQLLGATVTVWNAKHPYGAPTVIVPAVAPIYAPGADPFSATPINGATLGNGGFVSQVLGGKGGQLAPQGVLADANPITVNGVDGSGAISTAAPTIATSPVTVVSGVAATAIAVPVGIGLGAIAYSVAAGQARGAALGAIFGWIRSRL